MSKKMTTLTSNDKDILLSKSPFVLPDNPSNKQFSANQIRRKMYEPLLVLLDWLKRIIDENNENVNLTDAEIARIDGLIDQIESGGIVVGKALRDSVGNIIVDHYETKADAISKKEELNALIAALENLVEEKDTTIHQKVDEEITRATNAEEALDNKIEAETERAIGVENNLDDKIDDTLITAKRYADGLASKAYKTMGSVNSYADLPTNPSNGDVYNILTADPEHNIQAGENVVWNGTKWDELGGVFDTSKLDGEIYQLQKDVRYLTTAGIISAVYDDSTGVMEFTLSDGSNASYDDSTGVLTVVYE